MNKRILLIFLFFILLFSTQLISHGIDHIEINGGTGVEAKYENGNPVAGVNVKVFSPNESEVPFQQGSSDRNGRFMFRPDTPGDWTVIFNDGTGHGFKTKIHIDTSNTTVKKPVRKEHFPLLYKIITGISVLFGLTGLLLLFTTKKGPKR